MVLEGGRIQLFVLTAQRLGCVVGPLKPHELLPAHWWENIKGKGESEVLGMGMAERWASKGAQRVSTPLASLLPPSSQLQGPRFLLLECPSPKRNAISQALSMFTSPRQQGRHLELGER